MCSKAMMVVMMVMVMLVMSVSPRPHQEPHEVNKIEDVVSEILKEIETTVLGNAKKIKSAIEETVMDKMLEASASRMEPLSKVAVNTGNSGPAEANTNKNPSVKNALFKIFAARRAAALKSSAASSMPGKAKVAEGDITNTVTTTTLDPLEEYCKEACAAGVGGPECDCPDHPIG